MTRTVDFNCDLGEGFDDAAILPWITSASIACGGHAGDLSTMRATLRLCVEHGVAAGAHPSFPDRAHFGRREMALCPAGIEDVVLEQCTLLATIAAEEGIVLSHVKPHGALYNLSARDPTTASAIASAVARVDRSLVLFGLSGSFLVEAGERAGLRVAHEVFAERRYGPNARLLPRSDPRAVIAEVDAAVDQAVALATGTGVTTAGGQRLRLRADTLCLHGDRSDAPGLAREMRMSLERAGVVIRAPGTTSA